MMPQLLRVAEAVWVRSESTRKSAIGVITGFDTDVANASVGLLSDYYDWDHEQKLLATEGSEQWYPTYRLEPIKPC